MRPRSTTLPHFGHVPSGATDGGVRNLLQLTHHGTVSHRWNAVAFCDSLADAARAPLPAVSVYYDVLAPASSQVDIWHTIYNHVLDGPDAVVDWVKGTGLRPFIDPLTPDERQEFLTRYRDCIAQAYPPIADGKVLLRFPRLFIVAVR